MRAKFRSKKHELKKQDEQREEEILKYGMVLDRTTHASEYERKRAEKVKVAQNYINQQRALLDRRSQIAKESIFGGKQQVARKREVKK